MLRRLLGVLFILLSSSSTSFCLDLFEGPNLACDSTPIVCRNGTCGMGPDDVNTARVVYCGNGKDRQVDFNGDGYQDCAAAVASGQIDFPKVSILLNTASPACANRFQSADYSLSGLNGGFSFPFGNLVAGDLNGTGFSDFAIPNFTLDSVSMPPLVVRQEIAQAFNLGAMPDPFGDPNILFNSQDVDWDPSNRIVQIFNSALADPNFVLVDFEKDGGPLDAVLATFIRGEIPPPPLLPPDLNRFQDHVVLNLSRNNGGGLQPVVTADSFLVGSFPRDSIQGISLAPADFDGDGRVDFAVLITASQLDGMGVRNNLSEIKICLNKAGALDCSMTFTLNSLHPTVVEPLLLSSFSIVAGDFFGRGQADIAISEPGLSMPQRGIHLFQVHPETAPLSLNDAGHLPFGLQSTSDRTSIPFHLTTGCFSNHDKIDIATSVTHFTFTGSSDPFVRVISFSGPGNTPAFSDLQLSNIASGMGAALFNFDLSSAQLSSSSNSPNQNGLEDLVVVAGLQQMNEVQRRLFVFKNQAARFLVSAGADKSTIVGQPVSLSDASCRFEPADPDSAIQAEWEVVSPNSAHGSFSNRNSLNPNFQASEVGTYELRLKCRSRLNCPARGESSLKIQVTAGNPPSSPIPSPPSSHSPFIEGGGGSCSFSGIGDASFSKGVILLFGMGIAFLMAFRRKKTL